MTVRRRAREVPDLLPLAIAAFGAAAVVSLGVLFGFGVFPLEARALIPMAGLMVGNSMSATVLVARRVFEELRDKRDEVEARLALGAASADAARPYVRAALRTALIPQIETTKAVGLVFLPGAMTGLILAGVDPLDAVRMQAAVMYLVLGSVATTTAVVALGVSAPALHRRPPARADQPPGASSAARAVVSTADLGLLAPADVGSLAVVGLLAARPQATLLRLLAHWSLSRSGIRAPRLIA